MVYKGRVDIKRSVFLFGVSSTFAFSFLCILGCLRFRCVVCFPDLGVLSVLGCLGLIGFLDFRISFCVFGSL